MYSRLPINIIIDSQSVLLKLCRWSRLLTWYSEKVVPMNRNWKRVITIYVSSNNNSFTNAINYRSNHIKNFPLFWQLAENKVLVWKIFEIYCSGSYFITPTPLTMIIHIIMYHLIMYKNWSASWWSKLCSSAHASVHPRFI